MGPATALPLPPFSTITMKASGYSLDWMKPAKVAFGA